MPFIICKQNAGPWYGFTTQSDCNGRDLLVQLGQADASDESWKLYVSKEKSEKGTEVDLHCSIGDYIDFLGQAHGCDNSSCS